MARIADPLISVIIPVYNVEKYLDACIRSVVKQTYDNIEIILVDDKSPDGAGKICDAWAKKDERIQVIHKPKNEGLNMARATGFQRSTGKYITFLDSDDLFHEDNVKVCIEAMLENAADAVTYGFAEFSDATEKTNDHTVIPEAPHEMRVVDTKDGVVKYAILGEAGFPGALFMTAWGKMYSRRLVEAVNWHESNFRSYEDNFWTPQALIRAKKIVLLSRPLYFYRRNEQYGVAGNTLGNRLVGNSFNGKPVGYIEFIDLLHKFYRKLTNKYGVNITARLEELRYHQMWWRFGKLIEAGLLEEENNLQYLKDVWLDHHQRELERRVEQSKLIHQYYTEAERLQLELAGFLGIQRSARLFAGNIKRRLLKPNRTN